MNEKNKYKGERDGDQTIMPVFQVWRIQIIVVLLILWKSGRRVDLGQ